MTNKNLLEILLSAGKIKQVKRTGWIKKGISDVESVADHSYRMALMSIFISQRLSLDFEKLVKMALVHDIAEGVVGDIVWEVGSKTVGNHEDKTKQEDNAMKKIFENQQDLYTLWLEFEDQTSKEARVMKQIDKLEMVIQAGEYEKAKANKESLDEFWENVAKYLKGTELEELFDEIKIYFGKEALGLNIES